MDLAIAPAAVEDAMSDYLSSAIYAIEQAEDKLSRELEGLRAALEVLLDKRARRDAAGRDPVLEEAKARAREWVK